MLQNTMNAIMRANNNSLKEGIIGVEELMLLVNEIKTLREVNTSLKGELKEKDHVLASMTREHEERVKSLLEIAQHCATKAENLKRESRMSIKNKHVDILKVYGYQD